MKKGVRSWFKRRVTGRIEQQHVPGSPVLRFSVEHDVAEEWAEGRICIDMEIVGESSYQDYLSEIMQGVLPDADGWIRGGSYVSLKPQPDNPYDPDAVVVLIKGKPVGYIRRADTQQILPLLRERGSKRFWAEIVGRSGGSFGVFLGRKWIDGPGT